MAKLKITYNDGREPVEVEATPRAQVAFERQFDISIEAGDRVEHMYYLAYAAAQQSGAEPKDREFDAFLDSITEVDAVEEKQEPGPTPRVRRSAASST